MKKKILYALFILLFLVISACKTDKKNQDKWSVMLANTIIERYPVATDYPYNFWCYPHGFMLTGIDMVWQQTKNQRYYNYILQYANDHIDKDGKLKGFHGYSLDDIHTGVVMVWAYQQTKETKYKIAAEQVSKAFDGYPRTSDSIFWHGKGLKGEVWVDGVFMGQEFLLKYGKYIGDSEYCFNEAARQIIGAHEHLKKGSTGLLFHGWDEDKDAPWANKQNGLAPEVWSEGLGWYALVIADALELFPENHPKRPDIERIAVELWKGLKTFQDSTTGLWYDIVDKGSSPNNFFDISGSSMFLYSIIKGVNLGIIDKNEFDFTIKKGYAGIVSKARLTEVYGLVDIYSACDGVCIQDDYEKYVNYPQKINAKEAVAAFLWATSAYETIYLK